MSCEGHRKKYFLALEAEAQHPALTEQRLDRLYQAGGYAFNTAQHGPGQRKDLSGVYSHGTAESAFAA